MPANTAGTHIAKRAGCVTEMFFQGHMAVRL